MNQSDHPFDVNFDPDHGLQVNDPGARTGRASSMQLATKKYQKTGAKGGKGGGKKGSKKR